MIDASCGERDCVKGSSAMMRVSEGDPRKPSNDSHPSREFLNFG
jgi:hypothetical protein